MIHVNRKLFNFLLGLFVVFSATLTVIAYKDTIIPSVKALECKKYGSVCGWTNWDKNPKPCSQGDAGSQYLCCFWTNYPGTNCASVGRNKCACGNVYYVCGGSSSTPKPTQCSCNTRNCPAGRPANKFMTTMVGNGTGTSCGNPCSPSNYNCDPVSVNTPPSCSILPANIAINREEAPKGFNLTASDADYGDTVVVAAVTVEDTAGNLNSCVDVIRTIDGGSLANATVRTGSNNPGAISQTTTFYVDARTARGIYATVNGKSVCKGKVIVDIIDTDSDGGGPDTSGPPVSCSVGITVTDEAPQVSNISIYDRDTNSANRDNGAANNGNLVDGRPQLFVGSSVTGSTKSRASTCNEVLSRLDPIKCPGGAENETQPFSQRRNPLSLEFTVSDANGADDISETGVRIQRNSLDANKAVAPEITGTRRNSFSLVYSENEVSQRVSNSNTLYCYADNVAAPTTVVSTICPASCAACARKEGVSAIAGNPNALLFRVGLYLNDKDFGVGGQGMTDEDYSVYVSALDKVQVPLYGVTGKTARGWLKFTKTGVPCTAATCAAGTDFILRYDPVAPTITYITWNYVGQTGMAAKFNLSDNSKTAGGIASGVGGVTNRYIVKEETVDGEPLGDRAWATQGPGGPDFNGQNDRVSPVGNSITLTGDGFNAGESIIAGLCVYDNAGNMGCNSNNTTPYVFLAPWLKTSYGDIYSGKGETTPFTQTLPNVDTSVSPSVTDRTKDLYAPFTEQIFTSGTGLLMTGGTQGFGISGGFTDATGQHQLGFKSNYRLQTGSIYNLFGHLPFLPGNEFARLKATANLNCDLMNDAQDGTCQNNGSLSTMGTAKFNILYATTGSTIDTDKSCSKANVIFVTGSIVVSANLKKDSAVPGSGCMFVLANGSTLTIDDTTSNARTYSANPPPAGEYGAPTVDRFDAAIIAESGAKVQVTNGKRGTSPKSTDRLEIRGWLYAADITPTFKRDLIPGDNRRFPAEYIVYDANLLDAFRPLLGTEKTVDLTCGTSGHVFCKTN